MPRGRPVARRRHGRSARDEQTAGPMVARPDARIRAVDPTVARRSDRTDRRRVVPLHKQIGKVLHRGTGVDVARARHRAYEWLTRFQVAPLREAVLDERRDRIQSCSAPHSPCRLATGNIDSYPAAHVVVRHREEASAAVDGTDEARSVRPVPAPCSPQRVAEPPLAPRPRFAEGRRRLRCAAASLRAETKHRSEDPSHG